MVRTVSLLISLIVSLTVLCSPVWSAPDPNSGLTAWALMGLTPELSKSQEIRVGYEFGAKGILSGIELAGGFVHLDGPDAGVQEWSGRLYAIAHALDVRMLTQFLGTSFTLPNGNLYGGAFGAYTYDRANEWSGGYIVGGLVDWPYKWQTVAEYQSDVFNTDSKAYTFVLGLRRKF